MRYFYILITILSINTYADENLSVNKFVELLIQKDKPTLLQYSKFSGECGGENELNHILNECKKKKIDIYSNKCIDITNDRCKNTHIKDSYFLNFIRSKFETVGNTYKLIKTEKFLKGMEYELIEIKIGKNIFLLFHSLEKHPPEGNFFDIISINGGKIQVLMSE